MRTLKNSYSAEKCKLSFGFFKHPVCWKYQKDEGDPFGDKSLTVPNKIKRGSFSFVRPVLYVTFKMEHMKGGPLH